MWRPSVLFALVLGAASSASGAEPFWEVRGDFVTIKPGEPGVAVLRLSDGRTIEIPLESLSPASQAVARKQASHEPSTTGDDGDGEPVTVRGPFGRMVRVSVPESIKDVEADAIHCGSAAEAADVYRLFLAGDQLTAASRAAAQSRAREWAAMADEGRVRLGEQWVLPEKRRAAADEADKLVAHALELMRLGNGDLAEDELLKAVRINPESDRASFIMGLSYALIARNSVKAVEYLSDTVARDPHNAAALNDLAVLEVLMRRPVNVVEHFRRALENAANPVPIAENVAWAVKVTGAAKGNPALAKLRMPEKTIDELSDVLRLVTQDLKLRLPDAVAAPQYLGPGGVPFTASNLADVAKLFAPEAPRSGAFRRSLGFVVAPGHVVCPRRMLVAPDGSMCDDVAIEVPTTRGVRMTAVVVAAPETGEVALLRCDDLALEAIPLASVMPPQPGIGAVGRTGGSWLDAHPTVVRGTVMTPALEVQARGRFVHTAVMPRGLGGGPIVDAAGRVVGMVAPTPRTDLSGNVAGFGVPVERIWPLLRDHVPDVEAAGTAAADSDATGAESRAVAATVIVSVAAGRPMAVVPAR